MFSIQMEPYVDEYREYKLPLLCQNKIFEVCKDILKRGSETQYKEIYDAIYELVEAEIESEVLYD